MSTYLGCTTLGSGPVNESPTGMGMASVGAGTLAAPLGTGIFRGGQAQEFHECSGGIEAGEVSEFRHRGDGYGKLDATPGLEGFDHRAQAPGFGRRVELLFQALKSLGGFAHSPDIFLEDHVLCGRETDDLRAPSEMGWTPGGAACIADVMPEPEGFEPKFCRLGVLDGICTSPAEIA
jgi:hypothetical protein